MKGSLSFQTSVSTTHGLSQKGQRSVVSGRAPLTVQNLVRIRFSRLGKKKAPFYRIVAVDGRKPRETKPLEYLGWHDPLNDETNLNAPAIKKWLQCGAQPSDTVRNLLKKAMVITEE